jgi:hypothetical protein
VRGLFNYQTVPVIGVVLLMMVSGYDKRAMVKPGTGGSRL